MTVTYLAFNKPYGIVSQFSPCENHSTLKDFHFPPGVYPAGRLDRESEGLLILTNDGHFNQLITSPRFEKMKTYLAQVEGIPTLEKIEKFQRGLTIKNYHTLPCLCEIVDSCKIDFPPRNPPIRERKNIPTTWLKISLREGKNHQVRHMTAAIGHPTLRLIRVQIGNFHLNNLVPGQWKEFNPQLIIPDHKMTSQQRSKTTIDQRKKHARQLLPLQPRRQQFTHDGQIRRSSNPS